MAAPVVAISGGAGREGEGIVLKLYNSATRKKEVFVPYRSGEARIYACGVTVYDHCHLGHARASVAFDVLYRYLRQKGYQVTYVRNFTDIDDKIINRAAEKGVPWHEVARMYEASFTEDMKALHVLSPVHEPRATETIAEILALISRLIEKGAAYEAGGDVFFDVRRFPQYGKLSHKNVDELASGARIEINEAKRDPLDFALWKKAKAGEPAWESPWGAGRPGWHIECSAMALKLLGERLDIHCGGRDLIFPHHENEIAQSEAATGEPFVKYWLHNGLVNLGKAKMSKSTGNFLTIKSLLERYDYEAIRLFILRAHYRSPLEYSEKHLSDATTSLERFYETMQRLKKVGFTAKTNPLLLESLKSFRERYTEAMDDDLNTAQVIGAVFELVSLINKTIEESPEAILSSQDYRVLEEALHWVYQGLGVFDGDGDFLDRMRARVRQATQLTDSEIETLIQERLRAKIEKNWARADAIRTELAEKGIKIKDRPDGTTEWTA